MKTPKRETVNVKYVGPLADFSGYGESNRNHVRALMAAGVEVTTNVFSYSNNKENMFGESYDAVKGLEGRNIAYDIKVIHVPCDGYLKHLEPGKYNIGHLFWETDKMDPVWVWNCNLMDEIWTGSEHNKAAFIKSGVKSPIYIFPQPVDVAFSEKKRSPWEIKGLKEDAFIFFSVFQWIERKNPIALIKAFSQEFKQTQNTALVLKTYKEKFTKRERDEIAAEIASVKSPNSAPIYLNVELMDKEDVWRFYEMGDCFVLPHRGEGWGIPTVEAALFGKPVIATNCGGVYDWLTKECYYPLAHKLTKVKGMEWAPWYRENQRWADVTVTELRKNMLEVFCDQEEAKKRGEMGKTFVRENFSFDGVGWMLKNRLIEIQTMIDRAKEKKTGAWL